MLYERGQAGRQRVLWPRPTTDLRDCTHVDRRGPGHIVDVWDPRQRVQAWRSTQLREPASKALPQARQVTWTEELFADWHYGPNTLGGFLGVFLGFGGGGAIF